MSGRKGILDGPDLILGKCDSAPGRPFVRGVRSVPFVELDLFDVWIINDVLFFSWKFCDLFSHVLKRKFIYH